MDFFFPLVSSFCPQTRQRHFNQKGPVIKSNVVLVLKNLNAVLSVTVNVMWTEIQEFIPHAGTSCSAQMARFIS